MPNFTIKTLCATFAFSGLLAQAQAAPWTLYPTVDRPPTLGAPLGPIDHPGKEYVWESNRSADGTLNPGQVIAWDGAGGTQDGKYYTGASSNFGNVQVDAIANAGDAYFTHIVNNTTALLYSERTNAAWGKAEDTAFPIYYETATGKRAGWATRAQVNADWNTIQDRLNQEGNGQKLNLIGLEVFGTNSPNAMDSNMFSVLGDTAILADNIAYSVYYHNIATGVTTGYVTKEELTAKLAAFYHVPVGLLGSAVDLDALMVNDANMDGAWDAGDSIIFSLASMTDFGNGNYIGDAAYVLTFGGDLAYLNHGGHNWTNGWLGTNVDALEAAIPEPGSLSLLGVALAGFLARRRRWV